MLWRYFSFLGDACGHLRAQESDCKITWPRAIQFKTGRSDCTPSGDTDRPFLTTDLEITPNVHANGRTTVDFYKEQFGFTAREAIALNTGAHSFGKFNAANSFFRYFWTRSQHQIMNNQLFRHLASKPQWFMDCTDANGNDQFRLVGDAHGNMPETKWNIIANGYSKSGGPFQWFHRYIRKVYNTVTLNDCFTSLLVKLLINS